MISSAFDSVSWRWQTFIQTQNPLRHDVVCAVIEKFSGERTGRVGCHYCTNFRSCMIVIVSGPIDVVNQEKRRGPRCYLT